MKKFCLFIIGCFLIGSVVADSHDDYSNRGSVLDIRLGWMKGNYHFNMIPTGSNVKNVSLNMWRVAGLYKYQIPSEFYARLDVNYSQGKKSKSEIKYTARDLNFLAAVGWTMGSDSSALFSPFLAIAYNIWRLKIAGDDNKYYGLCGKLGFDAQYMLSEIISLGLVAMIGLPIRNSYKNNLMKKRGGTRLFYEVELPITYHVNDWKIGVELSYWYYAFKLKGSELKGNRNAYGVALILGCIF